MDLLNIDLPEDDALRQTNAILERNLSAIARRSPQTAELIRATPPRLGVEFVETDDGVLGVVAGGRTIASKRRPMKEAERLVAQSEVADNACLCVLGFGAGYHCQRLGEKVGQYGLVVCFEPEVDLLRSVLERIDHSAWIEATHFALLTDADARPPIVRALEGLEGVIGMGVKLLPHPPSAPRLGPAGDRFAERFTEVVKSTRTHVTTTLVQGERTLRNMLMNIDHYAASEGVGELTGAALDRPGVVVSAGPSLERNVDLLAKPGVRDRVVIIAVQTVLKPLLARGIRPHFVAALDYHEISRRFYEGLSADDVAGITLVVDPKVNPAVLDAWRGHTRFIASEQLDAILGQGFGPDKGTLKPGATVAHLCHYLARHLGCDPVMFIGQDLGFTDGQYYAPGAAIHEVWASELGPFRTLEQLEWERIARGKRTLRQGVDVFGRPMFTDEQMASYLTQFEADFAEDARAGLRVIDATEGGIAKQHTTSMTLAEALEQFAPRQGSEIALASEKLGVDTPAHANLHTRVEQRVRAAREQCERVAYKSRETSELLAQMSKHHTDQRRVNKLIARIDTIRDEVVALHPAWELTQFIDQNGALLRLKADRKIEMNEGMSELDRQRAQIERDAGNVRRIADSAAHLAEMFGETAKMLDGTGPRLTRDPITETDDTSSTIELGQRGRVEALIPVDVRVCGLGVGRDLSTPIYKKDNALRLTVRRLLLSERLDGVTLLAGQPDRVRTLLGDLAGDPRVAIELADGQRLRDRMVGVGKARLFGPDSWRGGIGGLSCYDEAFEPVTAAGVMDKRNLSAMVVVGSDWCLVDPALVDSVVERWGEHPARHGLVFTQAAPGLAGFLLARKTVDSLASAAPTAGARATIGGLIGYHPEAPRPDAIATPLCVGVPRIVRDCGRRAIADATPRRKRIAKVLKKLGDRAYTAGASEIATLLASSAPDATPRHLTLELCTGRLSSGVWGRRMRGSLEPVERPVLTMPDAHRILKQLAESREDAALTLHGVGDPLMHHQWAQLAQMGEELGIGAVHLRTELAIDQIEMARFFECGLSALSIDLIARTSETYQQLTHTDRHQAVLERMGELLTRRQDQPTLGGLPSLWVVPRLMRCDEVYPELADWYDAWTRACGTAMIDPLPRRIKGARVGPLPLPASAQRRLDQSTMLVRSDLSVEGLAANSLDNTPMEQAWTALCRKRHERRPVIEVKEAATAAA